MYSFNIILVYQFTTGICKVHLDSSVRYQFRVTLNSTTESNRNNQCQRSSQNTTAGQSFRHQGTPKRAKTQSAGKMLEGDLKVQEGNKDAWYSGQGTGQIV